MWTSKLNVDRRPLPQHHGRLGLLWSGPHTDPTWEVLQQQMETEFWPTATVWISAWPVSMSLPLSTS